MVGIVQTLDKFETISEKLNQTFSAVPLYL